MRFGPKCEDGFLPVFAVADAREARALLAEVCPRNEAGEFVSPKLAQEQSLERLEEFSTDLDRAHDRLIERGDCRCEEAA